MIVEYTGVLHIELDYIVTFNMRFMCDIEDELVILHQIKIFEQF